MLRKLLSLLSPSAAANGIGFSPIATDRYLDVLEKYGIEAHYYLPSVGNRDNDELHEALDALAHAGYIMTDTSGHIVGKVAKARLSRDEKAVKRRAEFKVIE